MAEENAEKKRYRVASGTNAQQLEEKVNELAGEGYAVRFGLDAPNQTPLVVMEDES